MDATGIAPDQMATGITDTRGIPLGQITQAQSGTPEYLQRIKLAGVRVPVAAFQSSI
jgi:hypothetical protein